MVRDYFYDTYEWTNRHLVYTVQFYRNFCCSEFFVDSEVLESLPEYSVSSCLLMNESKIMFCLWKESPKSNKCVTRDRGYYLIFPDFCWLFQRQNISYHQICCIYETSRKEIVWKPFIQSPYGSAAKKQRKRERESILISHSPKNGRNLSQLQTTLFSRLVKNCLMK